MALRRELPWPEVPLYIAAQVIGAVLGVWLAHAMFDLPIWQLSTTVRSSPGQWIAEATATFGLLVTIFGCVATAPKAVPYAVGLYITAAYWFTASTSFANPSVTIARSLSDTFAGIAPSSVPALHRGSACRGSCWQFRLPFRFGQRETRSRGHRRVVDFLRSADVVLPIIAATDPRSVGLPCGCIWPCVEDLDVQGSLE